MVHTDRGDFESELFPEFQITKRSYGTEVFWSRLFGYRPNIPPGCVCRKSITW